MSRPTASSKPSPRVALVCDWLTTTGGAEKVLLELHHMYPDAPIYTSQYSRKGIDWFEDADVRTGWLQIFPRSLRKFLGPLRQLYFSHLDLTSYDLVISVTGAEAKSVKTKKRPTEVAPSSHYTTDSSKGQDVSAAQASLHQNSAIHLCYCHVPTQYYWQMYDKYVENPGFGVLDPLVRFVFRLLVKPLREADYRAAQQPDQFITISKYAADQIKRYYGRESIVIAPPVAVDEFRFAEKSTETITFSTPFPHLFHKNGDTFPQENPDFSTVKQKSSSVSPHETSAVPPANLPDTSRPFIIACRQATWKRIDLAISACLAVKQPLLVVGSGPEHDHLVHLAAGSPLIRFLPWLSAPDLAALLRYAKGYIFPSLEPFGIAAVEALAAGCPVIAYREGGSQDFVKDGVNGILFSEQTTASLAKALRRFDRTAFDPQLVARSAEPFSTKHFRQKIETLVASVQDHSTSLQKQRTHVAHASGPKRRTQGKKSASTAPRHHGQKSNPKKGSNL